MLVFPTLTASAACSKPAAAGRWARQRHFEQVRRLVAEVAEAETTLSQGEQRLQGSLRVAAYMVDLTDVQNRGRGLSHHRGRE